MKRIGLVALVGLIALSLPAKAQSGDAGQTVAQWNASNATCRNANAPALEAMGACEQRDRFSKLLALMNHCYGPTDNGGPPKWEPRASAKACPASGMARTPTPVHSPGRASNPTAAPHRRRGAQSIG